MTRTLVWSLGLRMLLISAVVWFVPGVYAADPWTIAVLPDTQNYVRYPEYTANFEAQTQWIYDNVTGVPGVVNPHNIAFVTHEGDIVQTGTNIDEWNRADGAMSTLDGDAVSFPDGVVPYSAVIGNHDYDDSASRTENYRNYFGRSRYEGRADGRSYSWYGGSSPDELNHYQFFDGGGFTFLHLGLEWAVPGGPFDAGTSMGWAQEILNQYPTTPTIISTHYYLDSYGHYHTHGEEIFDDLVAPNPQVFMMLNGHRRTEYHQVSSNDEGLNVYEMMANYQDYPDQSWLRTIEFQPGAGAGGLDRISMETFAPTHNGGAGEFQTDSESQFSFDLDFEDRFQTSIASNEPREEPVPVLTTIPTDGATIDFGPVRIGSSNSGVLRSTNIGENRSELVGDFPAGSGEFGPGNSMAFGPLDFGESLDRLYYYNPVNRGSDTLPVTVTSNGGDSTITLSGSGVGPVFDSSPVPGSVLSFDTVEPGISESLLLSLGNISTDDNGGDNNLTDLTLLGVDIFGENGDLFEVIGFTPGTVLGKGSTFDLELSYEGEGTAGVKSGTLIIHTDQDANLGGYGSDFSYDIFANVQGDLSGSGLVETDGSILITLDSVGSYKVFIGDELGREAFDFTDLLHYDAGSTAPNWIFWAALLQDHVDGAAQGDEYFGESGTGDWIGTPMFPASNFDTGINVDPLPEGYKLWLEYAFSGEESTLVMIDAPSVPEPSTFALLGIGALGLLICVWRRCRH